MEELQELRRYHDALPGAGSESIGAARSRLAGHMRGSRRPRARRIRPVWGLSLAMALAAGLIGVQVVGIGGQAPVRAEAAEILEHAALVAERDAAGAPRPGQFVYIESTTAYGSSSSAAAKDWMIAPKLRRTWRSVDGTHNGLLRERPESNPDGWTESTLPGCVNGKFTSGAQSRNSCQTQPGYLGNLPTDPKRMYDYLYRNSQGGNPAGEQAFITIGDLIRENAVPPKALAAMFRAAAKIPGTTVVGDVVDPAGRKGVAVAYTTGGTRRELIFDSKTYEYFGEREVAVKDLSYVKKGDLIGGTARRTVAIVDEPGQLP
ncbi:CU044_5270 family protein [Nonomuraea sp. NPDC049400]|uniref:CU044_5270 family protein n=1 Tax=Nonomuraea sp. NPDC049400 TaxID=3364352 RepID=UPI003795631A